MVQSCLSVARGELDEKELVLLIQQVENHSIDGRTRRRHLVRRHAAAGVEHDAKADWHAIVAEVRDVLQLAVLVDGEVLAAEARHKAAILVRDGRGHVDQIDTALEPKPS